MRRARTTSHAGKQVGYFQLSWGCSSLGSHVFAMLPIQWAIVSGETQIIHRGWLDVAAHVVHHRYDGRQRSIVLLVCSLVALWKGP